jgi:hypothetical protein
VLSPTEIQDSPGICVNVTLHIVVDEVVKVNIALLIGPNIR